MLPEVVSLQRNQTYSQERQLSLVARGLGTALETHGRIEHCSVGILPPMFQMAQKCQGHMTTAKMVELLAQLGQRVCFIEVCVHVCARASFLIKWLGSRVWGYDKQDRL